MSYHVTNLGSFGGYVQADIDGYVHETAEEVLAGNWDAACDIDEDQAEEIAAHNRAATKEAQADIDNWRENN